MARARQHKHSQAELARMAGVSVKTLRDWRDTEGLDLGDVEAVKRRAAAVGGKDESLTEARRRRAIAAADAEEIRVRRLKGELVDVRLAQGVIDSLDNLLCIAWKGAPNELAGILDGLGACAMRNAIAGWIDGTLIPRFAAAVAEGEKTLKRSVAEYSKILPKSSR